MNKKYRNEFYPNGETMEERFFRLGKRYTKIPVSNFVIAAIIGFLVEFLGIGTVVDSDAGIALIVIGGLTFLIGIIGIFLYVSGLNMLAKAELLYNTRRAAGEKDDVNIPNKAQSVYKSAVAYTAPAPKKAEKAAELSELPAEPEEISGETLSEDPEDFLRQVAKASDEDLLLILQDQADLYTTAELNIIKDTLRKRKEKQ